MSKLYFCAMAGPNSLENLKELLEPIRSFFDGVVIVLHDSYESSEAEYLESIGARIIHLPFARRHSFARNHYLWCGGIEDGSWIVQCDHLERIAPSFAADFRGLITHFESQGINAGFYFNKAFIYQQHESLEFVGSPHEGLRRHDGQMKAVELSPSYPHEPSVRYSVRAEKRDTKFSWVDHYGKYYVDYPYGSNHCLLGNCDRGNEMEIFQQRETIRNLFRDTMRKRGIKLTTAALLEYWTLNPLDETMRRFVNSEKILNDLYRLHILGDESVTDEHKWISLKTI